MLSFAKGLLARKKSSSGMVANIASRAALAVLSNPDLLDCVFEFLGFHYADYLSLEYAIDIHALRLCHENDPLRRMALVCKPWHSSTVILLYRDIQVYQKESIPLLLRTLKRSGTLRQVVRSFAYIPPQSPMLKWVFQPVKELHNQVCEICALLPNVTPLHLKLIEPASAPLLKSTSNNIQLLHIIPVGGVFSPEGVMSLSFPILETLTLEFAGRQLSGLDTEFQLDAPNLTRLRLIGSYLNTRSTGIPSWLLDILPKIKCLEMISMFASEGDGVVYTILKRCTDTLESIVVNPRSIDINYEGMHDLSEFHSLKHITLRIPPIRLGLPPSKLPVNLMHLSIWQEQTHIPKNKFYDDSWWADASSACLRWVLLCLESIESRGAHDFKALTLFIMEYAWKPSDARSLIEQRCISLGVEISVYLWKPRIEE